MNNPRGFTLIMSVVIIGTILLLIAISSSRFFMSQVNRTVGLNDYLSAKYLAEGCAETALRNLYDDPDYTGNETVTIDGEICTIRPVIGSGSTTTIETQATVATRIYRLRVQLSSTAPPDVTSWRRVVSF